MVEIKITNEAIEFLMETTGQSREDVLDWFQIALSICDISAQQAYPAEADSGTFDGAGLVSNVSNHTPG